MSTFIDFDGIKQSVTIEQVSQMLGLQMKKSNNQLRGPCPACRSGGDRALAITPSKGAFYCFGLGKGGDAIALCAHIKNVPQREAAQLISEHFGLNDNSSHSSPAPERKQGSNQVVDGLAPLDYLDPHHEAVEAVGFEFEVAVAVGLGYAPKGLMRGTVAIPVRLPDGQLIGYIGVIDAKLPSHWHMQPTNVVPLKKNTA